MLLFFCLFLHNILCIVNMFMELYDVELVLLRKWGQFCIVPQFCLHGFVRVSKNSVSGGLPVLPNFWGIWNLFLQFLLMIRKFLSIVPYTKFSLSILQWPIFPPQNYRIPIIRWRYWGKRIEAKASRQRHQCKGNGKYSLHVFCLSVVNHCLGKVR